MIKNIKRFIKYSLYKLGILSAFNKIRNRDTLTVVLFHRVLPIDDIRWEQADMCWTVSDVFYEDCLNYFKKHYNIISLLDIDGFIGNESPLPKNALLITFDDGWSDNIDYALDISRGKNINPLLFVTTSSIGKKILSWQEALFSAWKINLLPSDLIKSISKLVDSDIHVLESENEIHSFISRIQNSTAEVKSIVAKLADELANNLPGNNQMLSFSELRELSDNGFFMGTHGVVHEPYTQIESPLEDMRESRKQLSEILKLKLPTSMSFPHGRTNSNLISTAVEAGYTVLFTGNACLNRLARGKHCVLGRLNIEQNYLQDKNGRLDPSNISLYLFNRKIE